MKNIVLTGYMASGKTTTGKLLSKRLDMNFLDTDEIISENEDMSINEIFEKYGEAYFRKAENELSKKLMSVADSIISTGGGFVLNKENIENLRSCGVIINLAVSDNTVKKRYAEAQATRPLIKNENIDAILKRYNDRKEFYANCDAAVSINETDSAEYVCEKVIEAYKNFLNKERK